MALRTAFASASACVNSVNFVDSLVNSVNTARMSGYTKLFGSIIHSTIWREPDHVRLVWITMLAMSNRKGEVESSVPGLADAARVSLEQVECALDVLQKPDRYSRSKEHDGRRIEQCPGGWRLLNYEVYRNRLSADDRREYQRVWQSNYRAAKAEEAKAEYGIK